MLSLVQRASNLSHLGRAYARAEAACWSASASSMGSDTGVFGFAKAPVAIDATGNGSRVEGRETFGRKAAGRKAAGRKTMACVAFVPASLPASANRPFGTKIPEDHT